MAQLKLKIVSQERQLVEETVSTVSAPTTEGEVTILPRHIPLFATLQEGVVRYTDTYDQEHFTVISKGFINVDPTNTVTIMIDSAVADREISVEKAQAAIEAAKQRIKRDTADSEELLRAEAELRYALLQLKVAEQSRLKRS